jgi:hypothetical protein
MASLQIRWGAVYFFLSGVGMGERGGDYYDTDTDQLCCDQIISYLTTYAHPHMRKNVRCSHINEITTVDISPHPLEASASCDRAGPDPTMGARAQPSQNAGR